MLSQSAIIRTRAGFTLIELLIGVALAGMALSVGIAGFVQTNNRSELTAATDQVISTLLETQKRTFAGEKPPADCTGALLGYRFTFANAGTTYSVAANCGGTFKTVDTVTLLHGVSFTGSGCIRYETVRGTVTLFSDSACAIVASSPLSIPLSHGSGLKQTTSVTAAGVIDEGVIQ